MKTIITVTMAYLLFFAWNTLKAQVSRCEDRPNVQNNGWCLPAPNGGQYCSSAGCNCTCDGTYWEWNGGPFQ